MTTRHQVRGWFGHAYLVVFLGGETLWMLWLAHDQHGWRRLVSLVLALGLVLCLAKVERERRRRGRTAERADAWPPAGSSS